jgi:ubiquinone/menaquinone biosynthesis C-methylase UbiE
MPSRSLKEVRDLYKQGVNIMRHFRESESSESSEPNSLNGILAAYDLQAGSYVQLVKDPNNAKFTQSYTAAIAAILDEYGPASVMEAGVGEATTLANVLLHMRHRPSHALGFDISWSRLAVARNFIREKNVEGQVFIGDLAHIPIETDSIDIVFTSHSIEPNRGREAPILKELFRVTRRYLVLLEPSNELGTEETRKHIQEHKYCVDLYRCACELGFEVIEHRLFDHVRNPHNQTALMIIAKQKDLSPQSATSFFACPGCISSLMLHKGNYFCPECLVVYPVVGGIPCRAMAHGIMATRYLEDA